MTEKIIILDFGSQYTQLIARNVREMNVYCEIIPFYETIKEDSTIKGIILSGSPSSVNDENAPTVDVTALNAKWPVLGICYGAQLSTKLLNGKVEKSSSREYGRVRLSKIDTTHPLLKGISEHNQVWMSHADTITQLAENAEVIAQTESIPVAAFHVNNTPYPLMGLQFHPEVTHSENGKIILANFVVGICACSQSWTSAGYIAETVAKIKEQVGDQKVVMALSGGVDSTVAATLIDKAIGKNLYCIFVDNGLLRKNEFAEVMEAYKQLGLNVKGVDAAHGSYFE